MNLLFMEAGGLACLYLTTKYIQHQQKCKIPSIALLIPLDQDLYILSLRLGNSWI